jgi:hypothetical protein
MPRHTFPKAEPVRRRPRPGALRALRHDFTFAVGVLADTLRDRPFNS